MPNIDVLPPAFHSLASYTYDASRLRRAIQTLAGDQEGVVGAADFAVTQVGTPSMNVLVAPGRALVNGDAVTRQGAYFLESASIITVAIAANASGQPRIDRIVLRDYDSSPDGGSAGTDRGAVEAVTGTPAASPVAPALPGGAISLATVAVANGAASITNANITDGRTRIGVDRPLLGVDASPVKIASQVLTVNAATIDFTGIPATFASLRVTGLVRMSAAALNASFSFIINNDTGANYDLIYEGWVNGSAATAEVLGLLNDGYHYVPGNTAVAGAFGHVLADFPNYASTIASKAWTTRTLMRQQNSGAAVGARTVNSFWRSTAAISRITCSGGFLAGSRFDLYGMP